MQPARQETMACLMVQRNSLKFIRSDRSLETFRSECWQAFVLDFIFIFKFEKQRLSSSLEGKHKESKYVGHDSGPEGTIVIVCRLKKKQT